MAGLNANVTLHPGVAVITGSVSGAPLGPDEMTFSDAFAEARSVRPASRNEAVASGVREAVAAANRASLTSRAQPQSILARSSEIPLFPVRARAGSQKLDRSDAPDASAAASQAAEAASKPLSRSSGRGGRIRPDAIHSTRKAAPAEDAPATSDPAGNSFGAALVSASTQPVADGARSGKSGAAGTQAKSIDAVGAGPETRAVRSQGAAVPSAASTAASTPPGDAAPAPVDPAATAPVAPTRPAAAAAEATVDSSAAATSAQPAAVIAATGTDSAAVTGTSSRRHVSRRYVHRRHVHRRPGLGSDGPGRHRRDSRRWLRRRRWLRDAGRFDAGRPRHRARHSHGLIAAAGPRSPRVSRERPPGSRRRHSRPGHRRGLRVCRLGGPGHRRARHPWDHGRPGRPGRPGIDDIDDIDDGRGIRRPESRPGRGAGRHDSPGRVRWYRPPGGADGSGRRIRSRRDLGVERAGTGIAGRGFIGRARHGRGNSSGVRRINRRRCCRCRLRPPVECVRDVVGSICACGGCLALRHTARTGDHRPWHRVGPGRSACHRRIRDEPIRSVHSGLGCFRCAPGRPARAGCGHPGRRRARRTRRARRARRAATSRRHDRRHDTRIGAAVDAARRDGPRAARPGGILGRGTDRRRSRAGTGPSVAVGSPAITCPRTGELNDIDRGRIGRRGTDRRRRIDRGHGRAAEQRDAAGQRDAADHSDADNPAGSVGPGSCGRTGRTGSGSAVAGPDRGRRDHRLGVCRGGSDSPGGACGQTRRAAFIRCRRRPSRGIPRRGRLPERQPLPQWETRAARATLRMAPPSPAGPHRRRQKRPRRPPLREAPPAPPRTHPPRHRSRPRRRRPRSRQQPHPRPTSRAPPISPRRPTG